MSKVEWDKAFEIVAKTYVNIAQTYSGPEGAQKLLAQGYDPDMVEAMHEAGTQTLKHRGGMPFLGATRIFGLNRVANMLRCSTPACESRADKSAARVDSLPWHTDLPPGIRW
jgi:nitrate reductase alpha subunit